MPVDLKISNKIKTLREKKGLSQDRFGSKIGVSGKSISAYETGRCMPPLKVLETISVVYDTAVFYIGDRKKESISEMISVLKKEISKIEEVFNSEISL